MGIFREESRDTYREVRRMRILIGVRDSEEDVDIDGGQQSDRRVRILTVGWGYWQVVGILTVG